MSAEMARPMLEAIKQLQLDIRRQHGVLEPRKRTATKAEFLMRHSPPSSDTLIIIIGVTGGAFILFLFFLLIYCIVNRKRNSQEYKDVLGSCWGLGSKSELSDASEKEDSVLDFFLPEKRKKKKLGIRKSVVGRVNPDIYQGGSSELEAFHSGIGLGTVEFSVVSEPENGNLIVVILRATGLPDRTIDKDRKEAPNPFVRVILLPDQIVQQTKVHRSTRNPVFNECVVFTIPPAAIVQKKLRLSVYDLDKKNVRHALGNAVIRLDSLGLQDETYRLPLEKLENILNTHLGDFELSLTVIPNSGKIKVGVLSCKGFNEFSYDPNSDHNCNIFVRTYMYRLHRMVRFRESSSCRLHSDIFFNEYFNFSVPLRYLDQTHFIFMIILSADAKDPGVPVGRVEVGPYLFARGEELMHWQQAVDNPRTTITMFHTINSPEVVKMSCCKD